MNDQRTGGKIPHIALDFGFTYLRIHAASFALDVIWHLQMEVRSFNRMYRHLFHDDVIEWRHFPRYWPFVPGKFPTQRPVTRSFGDFFDLRLNKRLRKQSWGWWFETPSRPLWRHRNAVSGSEQRNYILKQRFHMESEEAAIILSSSKLLILTRKHHLLLKVL